MSDDTTATATTGVPVRRITAFDPGKTTGIAEYDVASGEWSATELDVSGVFRYLDGMRRIAVEQQVISESFVITVNTAKNSQAGWSLELIGAMKYLVYGAGWPELKLQTPQVAKAFATDAKLKLMGWWTPGRGGHANDASRHLLTYCATRQPWADLVVGRERLKEMAG